MARSKKTYRRKKTSSRKKHVTHVKHKKNSLKKTSHKKSSSHKKKSHRKPVVARKSTQYKRGYGAKVGRELGALVGMPAVGSLVGGAIGRITGHGDYNITQNSILHGSQIPSFAHGVNSVRVKHREYIGDISSTTGFINTLYPINPGLSSTFPWLSTIAANYDEYKFHGLVFEYRSTAANSVGSTNLSLGTVVAATEYNASLPQYVSKLQMTNSEFSSSCNVCDSLLHPVECKKSETVLGELYTRVNNPIATQQDIRLFDLGNFQLATMGCQAGGNVIGELWASYDIEFFKAKYGVVSGTSIASAHYTATSGISTSAYFGTSQLSQSQKTGISLQFTSTTVQFPANYWPIGTYQYTYFVIGGSATVGTPTVAFTSNCNSISLLNGDTLATITNNGQTAAYFVITQFFQITGPSAILTFSGGTLPGSITSMDFIVTQINTGIST